MSWWQIIVLALLRVLCCLAWEFGFDILFHVKLELPVIRESLVEIREILQRLETDTKDVKHHIEAGVAKTPEPASVEAGEDKEELHINFRGQRIEVTTSKFPRHEGSLGEKL